MKATRTIWKTVVFAGAMLGGAACGGNKAASATEPSNTTEETISEEGDPCAPADPCEGDPCGDRARGVDEEEPCNGRGFVLS